MNTEVIQKPPAAVVPLASKKKRMSLDNIREGRIRAPFRILLYGIEKSGKSTFASGAPSPIWLGSESGTEHLDIKRLPRPETWGDVLEALDEVATNGYARGYRTFVADPLKWFEPLAVFDFTKSETANIATWGRGRGEGYQALADRWRVFVKGLERIWASGMNIILIAHSTVKVFNNPMGPDFERYEVEIDKRAAGMFKQWADHVLFCKPETFTKVDDNKRVKAFGSNATMLHTTWSPAFDAGNRAKLPPMMPLSWVTFAEALERGEEQVETLRAQIESGLAELADPEVEKKVRGYLADPRVDIAEVANAIAAKVGAKRAQAEEVQQVETKEG